MTLRSEALYTRTEIAAPRGICTGGHQAEADAGVRILQAGGNAVDALVAAGFTAFVVEPRSCGVGGYGHTSVWLAAANRFVSFDHYVRAPLKARPDMFEPDWSVPPTYYGYPHAVGRHNVTGFLAPAVPGAVAGLCDAHAMFGRLFLKRVLEPAIEAAEAGVSFTWLDKMSIADRLPEIQAVAGDAELLLRADGRVPQTPHQDPSGDVMDTSRLARLLKDIARRGKRAFHGGAFARAIGRYMAANGGILSAADLESYRTRIIEERPARYRGHHYVSCYDQVAYEALNILERYDLRKYGPDSFEYRHLMAEALAVAFTDNIAQYGDPDFVRAPVNGLASPVFAAARARGLSLRRALPRPVRVMDAWPYEESFPPPEPLPEPTATLGRTSGTSQVVAGDRWGNMAASCLSIGPGFGGMLYVPELGIFLNGSMANFDPRPGHPNSIAPGKMPIFAAPAIVAARGGRPRFAGSGSGNYRITTGVLHAMCGLIDFGQSLQQAVDSPKVHCQGQETYADVRLPARLRDRLARVGHHVVEVEEGPSRLNFGRVCAIAWNARRKVWTAGAGPVWMTGVAGY
ncbi:MAG: gamma-glutamyltransferase [Alphaproteobacteria bacterium]